MADQPKPFYLAGEPVHDGPLLDVRNKHTGEEVALAVLSGEAEVDRAIAAADAARDDVAALPGHARRSILEHVTHRLHERRDELAALMVVEAGKTISDARVEVDRAIETFRLSAEEVGRIEGVYQPLDHSPRTESMRGIQKLVPAGVCSLITPSNFPLNLAAHKVGPAIAAGCPFLLKPDPRTPLSSVVLGEILAETDLPAGAFSVLTNNGDGLEKFTRDERIDLLSFTGSSSVGWRLKAEAGRKRVLLELGGNAPCIVDETADIDHAADRIVFGAYYQAGQSCISVQRVLAHREVYARLRDALVERIGALRSGDPMDEQTFLSPLISERHAEEVAGWVDEAIDDGATILIGGEREGTRYSPTLLEHVPADATVSCEEVFGPVATLAPFGGFDEALRLANAGRYGLQAGVFTRDLHRAMRAFDRLRFGGVVINDVPSARSDAMPYGGVRDSGIGREGVRFAIREMMETRLMLLVGVGQGEAG